MDVILGIIFGGVFSYLLMAYLKKQNKKSVTERQSIVLLEKIKNVCKLITVEGEFSEIYHYENTKERFMKLISSKKKAILLVNAKAQIGYNLSKIKLNANAKSKTISITDFPQAEILTIDTDLRYYDKSDGLFNKFEAEDLTALNKEAKQFIVEKIPESGLVETANKELLEAVDIITNLVETIGWKVDHSSLHLEVNKTLELKK
jgi:predicted SPOUT superfamily RNA methylase MTH1